MRSSMCPHVSRVRCRYPYVSTSDSSLVSRSLAAVWHPCTQMQWHADRSLPLLAWFVLAWGWGEVVGYWAGAGASLRRVC